MMIQSADRFFDLSAAVISFILVRIVIKPAGREHPFGHGKVENLASALQVLVIFVIGVLTVYIAVLRIMHGETLQYLEAGLAVIVLSILASVFLSEYYFGSLKPTAQWS